MLDGQYDDEPVSRSPCLSVSISSSALSCELFQEAAACLVVGQTVKICFTHKWKLSAAILQTDLELGGMLPFIMKITSICNQVVVNRAMN